MLMESSTKCLGNEAPAHLKKIRTASCTQLILSNLGMPLTWGLFFSSSSVNVSNSAMRNSLGFRRTQAGWAIKILRKTPPTESSPSASPYTTAKSSGNWIKWKEKWLRLFIHANTMPFINKSNSTTRVHGDVPCPVLQLRILQSFSFSCSKRTKNKKGHNTK